MKALRLIILSLFCLISADQKLAHAEQSNDGCLCPGKPPDEEWFSSPCNCGIQSVSNPGYYDSLSNSKIGFVVSKVSPAARAALLKKGTILVKTDIIVPKKVIERLAKKYPRTKFVIEDKTLKAGNYKVSEAAEGGLNLNFQISVDGKK